jgi:hypothetical protein
MVLFVQLNIVTVSLVQKNSTCRGKQCSASGPGSARFLTSLSHWFWIRLSVLRILTSLSKILYRKIYRKKKFGTADTFFNCHKNVEIRSWLISLLCSWIRNLNKDLWIQIKKRNIYGLQRNDKELFSGQSFWSLESLP